MKHKAVVFILFLIVMIAVPLKTFGLTISGLNSSVSPNPTSDYLGTIEWNAGATITNNSTQTIFIDEITWHLYENDTFQGGSIDEFISPKWIPIPGIPEVSPGGSVDISTQKIVGRNEWHLGYEGSYDPDNGQNSGLYFYTGLSVHWYCTSKPDDKGEAHKTEIPEPTTVLLLSISLMGLAGVRRKIS